MPLHFITRLMIDEEYVKHLKVYKDKCSYHSALHQFYEYLANIGKTHDVGKDGKS